MIELIYFETDRLRMRAFETKDLLDFKKMNEDPEVMEYFPKILTHKETTAFYEAIMDEFQSYGYGLYAAELKETGEFIGFIGFHHATFEADFTPCVEIGWRLKKEVWGKGLATEGAKACLEYAEENLQFENVYSFTAEINTRSERIMQKIGLKKVKTFLHPKLELNDPLKPHVLYALKVGE